MRHLFRLSHPIGFLPDFTNHQPSTIHTIPWKHPSTIQWNLPLKNPPEFPKLTIDHLLGMFHSHWQRHPSHQGNLRTFGIFSHIFAQQQLRLRARKRPTETTCCCTLLLGEVCLGRKLKISRYLLLRPDILLKL